MIYSEWTDISKYPENNPFQFLLCNTHKKWIRFGRKYPGQKDWYYSGTNERSQYAQVKSNDIPTHFMSIPELPKENGVS